MIELPPPPLHPSLFFLPLSLLCVLCTVGTFPSSEPGFNAVVALSLVLRNRAAVVLRCILPSPLPQAGWSLWERAAQKTDLHFSILERVPLAVCRSAPQRRASLPVRPLLKQAEAVGPALVKGLHSEVTAATIALFHYLLMGVFQLTAVLIVIAH